MATFSLIMGFLNNEYQTLISLYSAGCFQSLFWEVDVWYPKGSHVLLRQPSIIFLPSHHYNIFCYTNNLPCIIFNVVFRFTDGTGNEANFFGI